MFFAMKRVGLLALIAACGGGNTAVTSGATSHATGPSACREAYAEYEVRWRAARTEEIDELVGGDKDILEEILYYELATLPSRVELDELRDIYAVIDAFLWNAPWPQALSAAETAIGHCGDKAPRPT